MSEENENEEDPHRLSTACSAPRHAVCHSLMQRSLTSAAAAAPRPASWIDRRFRNRSLASAAASAPRSPKKLQEAKKALSSSCARRCRNRALASAAASSPKGPKKPQDCPRRLLDHSRNLLDCFGVAKIVEIDEI